MERFPWRMSRRSPVRKDEVDASFFLLGNLLLVEILLYKSQFSEGFSTESMMKMSAIFFTGSNFNPS
jgi:hypothetical protein